MAERIDNHGKWKIENGVELLVEPSTEWITINQPPKTPEQIQEELQIQYSQLVEQFIFQNELYSTQGKREAIFRKKIADIDDDNEFDTFNAFVEMCKVQARSDLGIMT